MKVLLIEVILLIGICFLFGSSFAGSPWNGTINLIDEGQFGAWANHMLYGKHMFQEIYITYGPLYVYPLYLLFKLFGASAFLVRVYLTIGSIFGIVSILLILHRLQIQFIFRWLVLLLLAFLQIIQLRQGIGWLTILFLLIALNTNKTRNFLFAGITSMISFLVSPDIGLIVIILSGMVLLLKAINELKLINFFKKIFAYVLGFLVVVIPFYLWANSEGWLAAYFQTTLDVMASLSGIEASIGQGFPKAFQLMPNTFNIVDWLRFIFSREMILYWGLLFYLISFLYIVIKFLSGKLNRDDGNILLILLFGFMLYHILLGRSGLGHFLFVLSPILILGGYYSQQLLKSKSISQNRLVVFIVVLLLSFFAVRIVKIYSPVITDSLKGSLYVFNNKTENPRIGRLNISQKQFAYINAINEFVSKNTSNKEAIFFLSDEPGMYMLVDRYNPTRYDLPFIANTKDKRYELLSDLQDNKPRYIFENKATWAVDGITNRKRLPEVSKFIDEKYIKVATIENTFIYKLKSSQ